MFYDSSDDDGVDVLLDVEVWWNWWTFAALYAGI